VVGHQAHLGVTGDERVERERTACARAKSDDDDDG
jgi:hypothetical protein